MAKPGFMGDSKCFKLLFYRIKTVSFATHCRIRLKNFLISHGHLMHVVVSITNE